MTNDKDYNELDFWLFFYDASTNTWNAALKEEYNDCVKDPKATANIIKSTSITYLINFIVAEEGPVN